VIPETSFSVNLYEMLNDPADKTHRKPRQLRNTPLLKYVNLISLGVTLIYAGACYISYKKK